MCTNLKNFSTEGNYKENNYNGKKGEHYIIVTYAKCGVCEECIAEKANNWVIRNNYEEKAHKKICFITLTYAKNPYFLIKKDLQDFIKRLRRRIEYRKGEKIRYFACGEYGTLNGRPHFHIIIYGWNDKTAKIRAINKKLNVVKESKIINEAWAKGLTSYQEFNENEIPYIALYNTPKEEFTRSYKTTTKKAKELIEKLKKQEKEKNIINYKTRINQIKELQEQIKKAKKEKKDYILIKEFNTWSKALGWEEFIKEYYKHNNYIWKEYIKDKEFLTPTPWIKKLANKYEDEEAIKEMRKRASFQIDKGSKAENLNSIQRVKQTIKQSKEIIKFKENKKNIENI